MARYTITNNDPSMLGRQPPKHRTVLTRQLEVLGLKGGLARARNLSSARKKEIAKLAAEARWSKETTNKGN